jgi:signal transduction histidine kinase
LISCRNVLIYLGPVLQKKVVPVFHYALKPTGYLLLGTSETIGQFPDLFEIKDKKFKLYLRRPATVRVPLDFAVPEIKTGRPEPEEAVELWNDSKLQREADRIVLARHGPPGVVIDEQMNIVQFRGRTGPYLEAPSGAATLSVLRMAREGLMVELRNAIQRCKKENAPVRRQGLHFKTDAGVRRFDLEVVPLQPNNATKDRHLLVLFEEPQKLNQAKAIAAGKGAKQLRDREMEQLSADLASTKEYLQSIIEEQEATNEELRSANEEIQSSNEELQSTNEELETAKEELQSTNEELNTVNEELQNRNLQLSQTGNDLMNLLSNVNIPIVMLGNDLRIRRFTPISERALNLIASDIGRPITDINLPVSIPNLEQLIVEVIENLTATMIEVQDSKGRPYSLRLRPYRTEESKIDGVVMVLVDLDPQRSGDSETELAESAHAAHQLMGEKNAAVARLGVLEALASRLLAAQEEEGARIARDLHDDLGQRLTALDLRLRQMSRDLPAAKIRQGIRDFSRDLGVILHDLSRIAYGLHPSNVEDLGLSAVLRAYANDFSARSGIKVTCNPATVPTLPRPVSLALFRIVQEALRNVEKHSGAKKASIQLFGSPHSIRLTIRDAGRGMTDDEMKSHAGLGLTSMRERARLVGGSFDIKSGKDGFEVIVQVPLSSAPEGQPVIDEKSER